MWNDRRLARRAARGDRDAFGAIFRRYEQDLYRYCVAILGDQQDAQEALQNTMVKALRALPGERRQIELKPWLYRVAHNESIELRRRARPTAPLAEEMPAPGASPEQRAADRRRLRDLLADIGELPERHRGVLVMRELAGLDFEEIAAALDTSPGAARQVLYEARRSLQQMSDGREMTCDAVTVLLSDRDGRVARRRDVRAHLRDCPECRRFADGIRSRSETLAGIAPLPALAAAAIAKGALAGAAGGGAAATGAAGTSTGGVGGAAGVAGGAATKVASTGAILKSAAAIVAVVGVGAVAVDHSHLLRDGGSPAVVPGGRGAPARPGGAVAVGRGAASARPNSLSAYVHGRRAEEVGLKRPDAMTARSEPTVGGDGASEANADPAGPVGAAGTGHPERHAHPRHPAHPAHPPHPAHPVHPGHPVHPVHPAHPHHPLHPDHPAHPEKSGQPSPAASHPERPPHPQHSAAAPAGEGASAAPAHPELPSRPAPAEVGSTPAEVVTPGQGAAAAAESTNAVSGAPDVSPGQVRKEATE